VISQGVIARSSDLFSIEARNASEEHEFRLRFRIWLAGKHIMTPLHTQRYLNQTDSQAELRPTAADTSGWIPHEEMFAPFPLKIALVSLSTGIRELLARELYPFSVQIDGEFRSANQAAEHFKASRSEPRLLIYHMRRLEQLSELKQLNGQFGSWPILTLLEGSNNLDDFVAVNRAGASQIVGLPLVAEDFRQALHCLSVKYDKVPAKSTVVAVTGATGGTGATSLAINLAYEMANVHQQETILAEMNLTMGAVSSYLEVEPRYTLGDLFQQLDRMDAYLIRSVLTPVTERLHLLPGPQTLTDQIPVAKNDLSRLLSLCQRLAEVVVLDVPCNYHEIQFSALGQSEKVILLGEQTIPSIRSLKLIKEVLPLQVVQDGLFVVINRYNANRQGFTLPELAKLLNVSRIYPLADDPTGLHQAGVQGKPLRQVAPQSPYLTNLAQLIPLLFGVPDAVTEKAKKGSGLFTCLANVFKR
jgi:pilus assembly protein CpaE